MYLTKAKVVSTIDFSETGKIYALIPELGNSVIEIIYVTPYHIQSFGGIIAIPEPGSTILVAKTDNSETNSAGEWFYMGTVVDILPGNESREDKILGVEGIRNIKIIPDSDHLYRASFKPEQIIISSPRGNKLVLSDSNNEEYQNIKVELNSSTGKSIQLNDSPLIDAIIIRNEHGDRIKISTNANGMSPERGIEIEAQGTIKIISREGNLDAWVIDGKNINIINDSTGSKRDPNFPNEIGNVNIQSRYSNVNISVKSPESNIILNSEGKVSIKAKDNITIESSQGNVNIKGVKINLN